MTTDTNQRPATKRKVKRKVPATMPLAEATELPIHPFADVFPMMTDKKLQLLADDIKANGQQSPVLIANDQIIDGRNRLAACKLVGVDPRIKRLTGQNDEQIREIIASHNLHRRQLTARDRAEAADKLYQDSNGNITRQDAAKMFGIARRTVTNHVNAEAKAAKTTSRVEIPHRFVEACSMLRKFEPVADDTENGRAAMASFERATKLIASVLASK